MSNNSQASGPAMAFALAIMALLFFSAIAVTVLFIFVLARMPSPQRWIFLISCSVGLYVGLGWYPDAEGIDITIGYICGMITANLIGVIIISVEEDAFPSDLFNINKTFGLGQRNNANQQNYTRPIEPDQIEPPRSRPSPAQFPQSSKPVADAFDVPPQRPKNANPWG